MRTAARISAPVFIACISAMARSARPLRLALDVAHLAADHAAGPGAGRQLGHQPDAGVRIGVAVLAGEQPEGQRQEGVAGEDRRGLVIGLVHGRLAAAQVVVVHGRQVVVDQRVAVDHLDGEPGDDRAFGRRRRRCRRPAAPAAAAAACRR